MIYLVEFRATDTATEIDRTLRFSTAPFVTEPTDDPPNTWFDDSIKDAGNYERFLFGRSRTRGESAIGGGDIQIVNVDNDLDELLGYAFDGRPLTIYALESRDAPWSSRQVLFQGTMDQAEFGGRLMSLRIRDRLALLRDTIQRESYLGTTINGNLPIAEGGPDLKDVKKPMLFGRGLTIAPVVVDAYDHVFQVSSNALSAIADLRESGVPIPIVGDYPTLAALKAAAIEEGKAGTCLASGLVRTKVAPVGTLTLDAVEGATLADRSAARIAQRILSAIGTVNVADFDRLHALNPAECGLWIGTIETTILAVASTILASVGAFLTVDRFGTFRVGRLELPAGAGEVTIDGPLLLGTEGLARNAPGDEGGGIPARSVTVRYARSCTIFTANDLKEVASDDAFRARVVQEWRQVKVPSERNARLYPKGPELIFDTCLVTEADARAEAERLLAIYGARRDLFVVRVASSEVGSVDLDDVVTLAPDRFGMAGGVPVRVLGVTASYASNVTELELWR